ncbi:enoyl-CoA hydratase/isomerase family protein [Aeromicrobium sp. Leaf350]|uniref:enoyl-CoA hydratase/isomerase family protein n=1 Tax=Aeromicrobium sp. Leaf350 TaxID=2876565 RepID=UPI001E4EEF81|nr:enoyl-CoA hydratase/isomerase family protein [Aeromicrobium sp. Leaf350]
MESRIEQVVLTVESAVAKIELNAPERHNAMDGAGWLQLVDALRSVRENDEVRVLIVTGVGPSFCAGAALGGVPAHEHPYRSMRLVGEAARLLHDLGKPSIAMVRGNAVGAGWGLALACDLVAADSTARFSTMFSKRGLSLDFGLSWTLPRAVGMQHAKRLTLLGEFVGAEEALDRGLVNWAVGPDELDPLVADLARELAQMPPVALAQSLDLVNHGSTSSHAQALSAEAQALAVNAASTDIFEARRAFADRTDPLYTGGWALSAHARQVPSTSKHQGAVMAAAESEVQ